MEATTASPFLTSHHDNDSDDELQFENGPLNHRKSVQFSRFLVVHETWDNDEYDRTSMEPARLNFKEYSELLQLRCDLRRQMEKMMKAAAANGDSDSTQGKDDQQRHRDDHVDCME